MLLLDLLQATADITKPFLAVFISSLFFILKNSPIVQIVILRSLIELVLRRAKVQLLLTSMARDVALRKTRALAEHVHLKRCLLIHIIHHFFTLRGRFLHDVNELGQALDAIIRVLLRRILGFLLLMSLVLLVVPRLLGITLNLSLLCLCKSRSCGII